MICICNSGQANQIESRIGIDNDAQYMLRIGILYVCICILYQCIPAMLLTYQFSIIIIILRTTNCVKYINDLAKINFPCGPVAAYVCWNVNHYLQFKNHKLDSRHATLWCSNHACWFFLFLENYAANPKLTRALNAHTANRHTAKPLNVIRLSLLLSS